MDFNLHAFPNPRRDADGCDLDQLPEEGREVETEDLFKKKRMSGWWPFYEVNEEGVRELTVSCVITELGTYMKNRGGRNLRIGRGIRQICFYWSPWGQHVLATIVARTCWPQGDQ